MTDPSATPEGASGTRANRKKPALIAAAVVATLLLILAIGAAFGSDEGGGGVVADPSVGCERPDGTTYWKFGTSCQYPDVKVGP